MNPWFLLCPALMLATGCSSTKSLQRASDEGRYLPVTENVYLSKYETSNLDYRTFLSDLLSSGRTEDHAANLLDTALWAKPRGDVFATYYHAHPSYNDYPVVTVSYEQANNYCNWLTAKYNTDRGRKFKKVIFRLPTSQEWLIAASGGNEEQLFPWRGSYMRNKNGNFLANFRRVDDSNIAIDSVTGKYVVIADTPPIAGSLLDRSAYTASVSSFWPSERGFYNLAGNVAEMVAEKGVSKGGSWGDPGYYLRNSVTQYYTGANIKTGFRVAMEVVEK